MLNLTQLQAIKAEIVAAPLLSAQPMTPDGAFAIAQELNKPAAPAFWVWRTDVSTYEIRSVLVWSEYDALSVSRQNAFQFLCSNGTVNAALLNVRQGIASIFAGPGQTGNRDALIAIAKRAATRAEKVLSTGTGSDASPATMGFEGLLTYQNVEAARAS